MILDIDPESVRIVLDLADARLQRLRAQRPASGDSIGQLAFDELAAVVGWKRHSDTNQN